MKKTLYFLVIILTTSNAFANFDSFKKISKIEMDVVRNGKIIGHSNYFFEHEKEMMTVRNHTNFNVDLLGVKIFSVTSEAIEKYKSGNLIFFESNTLQNEKKKFVNLFLENKTNKFQIKGSSYSGEADSDCIIGNWWNWKILESDKQISPLSGSIKEQVVTFLGTENLIINDTTYTTDHFTLVSKNKNLSEDKKLNFDIWYNKKNNLIMKVSYSRMGNWEYVLKKFE
tara:strand:+ start:2770 stop:3450 length:681 start_codon:yes stop_codon:yes gene_type:complete